MKKTKLLAIYTVTLAVILAGLSWGYDNYKKEGKRKGMEDAYKVVEWAEHQKQEIQKMIDEEKGQ